MKHLLRYIRAVASGQPADEADRELLNRFAQNRDEAAFAVLVGRYGWSVWSVCRRLLDREHDAEDAFQATFLTLARKAGSIRCGDSLPAWLHGVARRIAANLRRNARRQADMEARTAKVPRCAAADPTWREGLAVLDEELARLPERYRAVLIVCCLNGRSRDEAASQLGWSEGQVKGRLERAREMLRRRLAGRGFPLAALLLAAAVSRPASAGAGGMALPFAPAALVSSTINTAMSLVFGLGTTSSVVSPKVAALMKGVLKTMLLTRLKTAIAVLLVLGVVGFGGGLLTYRTPAAQQEPAEKGPVESRKGEADVPKKAATAGDKRKVVEGDREKLQGTWTLVETQKHGKKVTPKDIPIKPHKLVIAGDKVVLHHLNANVNGVFPNTKGTFELDSTKNPREITITWLIQWCGIYNVEGDTLTICFNPDNAIRPDEFRTTADSGRVLFIYQRAKPNLEKGRPELSNSAYPVETKDEAP